MRRFIKHAGILLGFLLVVGFLPLQVALAAGESGEPSEEPGRFVWLDDLDEARILAKAQDRPLLIVFRCEP